MLTKSFFAPSFRWAARAAITPTPRAASRQTASLDTTPAGQLAGSSEEIANTHTRTHADTLVLVACGDRKSENNFKKGFLGSVKRHLIPQVLPSVGLP